MRRQLPPPWELFPDPLGLFRTPVEAEVPEKPSIRQEGCAYGIECLKNHLLRAHLYLEEALRFSSEGEITPAARAKIRLAREQVLAEDDFVEALKIGPPLKYEILRLLASCRSWWKAVERSGLDVASGTLDDLQKVTAGVKDLVDFIYNIDRRYREEKTYESAES